jgi:O-antigen/teichoic acid export membrane protein
MESIRKIIHGSSLRVVGLASSILVAFFLMPFLVHRLGDRVYGYWALIGSILGYYGIMDFGIVSAVQFYVAKALGEKDAEEANRAISVSFFVFAAIGVVIFLISGVIAFVAHRFVADAGQATVIRDSVLIMGVGFAIGFPGRAFLGAISAHLRWDLLSGIGLVALVVRTALIVAVIESHGGLVAIATVTIFVDIANYIAYYFVLHRIQSQLHISLAYVTKSSLKHIVRYSSYSFLIKISYQIRYQIDIWVVGAFLSAVAVTHYAIGSRLALSFMDLMLALMGLLHPWFSIMLGSKDYAGIKRVLEFGTKISGSIAAIVTMLLAVYGSPFIRGWMGKDYADAYWPLVLLVTGVFFEVSQLPSTSFLFGVSLNRFLAQISVCEAIANLVLSLYWARIYGMIGVAMGTLVPSFIVRTLIQPIYVCRKSGIPIWEYYVGLFGRATLASAIGVVGPWLVLFRWVPSPNLPAVLAMIACQGMIAVAVAYFLVFDSVERCQIRTALLGAARAQTSVVLPQPTSVERLP